MTKKGSIKQRRSVYFALLYLSSNAVDNIRCIDDVAKNGEHYEYSTILTNATYITGEYVLVRVDHSQLKLDVQGRFEQVPRNIYGPVNATHLTSVVAASNNSVPIEVTIS